MSLDVDGDHDEIHYTHLNAVGVDEALAQAIEALAQAIEALVAVRWALKNASKVPA